MPDSLRLFVGDSQKLGVNVYPDNATIKDVVWKSANESIAVVDEDGEVFAISSGKVKITATSQDGNNIKGICWVYVTPVSYTHLQDELYTVYNMPYQLAYKITVIDGFGLSTVSTTVNIGSSIDIKALVTNQPSKSQITYTVTNQANEAGVIPTYDLIEVRQSDDGAVFTVTGVASGVTHLTVSQNINGVIKSETCVIYVTTPVGEDVYKRQVING